MLRFRKNIACSPYSALAAPCILLPDDRNRSCNPEPAAWSPTLGPDLGWVRRTPRLGVRNPSKGLAQLRGAIISLW